MDKINFVLLFSRWLHLGSAIVAIGGAVFMRFVLMPAASKALDDAAHQKLREGVRRRWAVIVYTCITVLVLTGALNFVLLAILPKIRPMPYHALFTFKLLFSLGVFLITLMLIGRGRGSAMSPAQRTKWLTVLIALAALIMLISGVLSQVRSWG